MIKEWNFALKQFDLLMDLISKLKVGDAIKERKCLEVKFRA